ncbi:ribonuclease J, partial [Candidatus Microgenomates bacterium]|nr:ribonuclease J [Candidatus Microgenomates bacterium]
MDSTYKLRFVPLGGVIGVTKNMYVYELYQNDELKDILIVDCGIGFPQDKALGVDFVIPDISYLMDKKDKIRGILLTHGHEDHISALPYHYEDLGRPPMLTSKLTAHFIKNKFKEFSNDVDPEIVDYDREYTFGDFKCEFINMTHSIPDIMHILIKTPVGNIYHGADYKLDLTPPYGDPPDFYKITKAGHDGVLCLMSDCLGSQREGLTLSENVVGQTFEDEMRKTRDKFIMSTFSSNISRIRQCVEAAIKFNRKLVFMGRSMKENTLIAQQIGYLPIPEGFILKEEQVMKSPPNKICMIVAGSQGQYNSALAKLANNQHRLIKITPGDKVVFSSDPIPGNETGVYEVIEDLVLLGAQAVYSDIQDELHASGHGNQEDMKFLMRFVNPKYFIPIGGTVRHQRGYQQLAGDMGYKKESVFLLDEGETVIFEKKNARLGSKVDTKTVYVDAYGVGDVGNAVLRDRKSLSEEGIVVVIVSVD